MKPIAFMSALLAASLLVVSCRRAESAEHFPQVQTLGNGIRVVSVHFPGSTNVSIFTFLPMGLTSDRPDQAQWSHLIEHLVIRSTIPAHSAEANAETLPDHMRLDFYGHSGNWREGLTHHRRWLEGMPFTQPALAAEKPKVIAECDFTARNLATHKFALAAWSQGLRHGAKHAALKRDVTGARLADVQRLRDEHLAASNRVTVCIVGGVSVARAFEEAGKQLAGLHLKGAAVPPVEITAENLEMTWDLDARHLLLTWPIPDDADKSSQSRCRSIYRGRFENFSVGNVRAIHTHQAWKRAIRIPCFGNGIGSIRESS